MANSIAENPEKQSQKNDGGFLSWLGTDKGQRNISWFIMTLPAIVWVFIFKYLVLVGLLIAFQDYRARDGIFGSEWVGLENFQFLFSSDLAIRATRNTIFLNLMFILVGLVVTLFVAALLFEVYNSAMTRFYQTILLFPVFISWVIVSYFVFALLRTDGGIVNNVLNLLGLEAVRWYRESAYWPFILMFANLWKYIGIGSMIYLAGMIAIDTQLYEAARIDGAGRVQQYFSITLPILMPLIVIQLLISLGSIFSADFGLFYQVPRNSPILYETTDVLDTFIFRSLVNLGNVGMSAAAGLYQSIVGFGLVLAANWLVRRFDRDGDKALF